MKALRSYTVTGVQGMSETEIRRLLGGYTQKLLDEQLQGRPNRTFEVAEVKKTTLDKETGQRKDWGGDRCLVVFTTGKDETNAVNFFNNGEGITAGGAILSLAKQGSAAANTRDDWGTRELEAYVDFTDGLLSEQETEAAWTEVEDLLIKATGDPLM
eukprot:937358-Prorocentrum_minimum.AAC.1